MDVKYLKRREFMARALELARRGIGDVEPNPPVGCVVVKKGRVVGEGWHRAYGGAHAEVAALKKAGKKARGATAFVTLEPCCHKGKTGPCCEALARAGVKCVVVAIKDPNSQVRGKGMTALKKAGVKVETGVMQKEAGALIAPFRAWLKRKTPWVALKVAVTQEGNITWGDGKRKKITGKEADAWVQGLRRRAEAVMVGLGTMKKDNPRLTVRGKGKNLLRVVLDAALRTPPRARMLREKGETLVYCKKRPDAKRKMRLENAGAKVVPVGARKDRVNLDAVLKDLYGCGVRLLLVEGGQELNTSLLGAGLVDTLHLLISPKKHPKGKFFVSRGRGGMALRLVRAQKLGRDVRVAALKEGKG